MKRGFKGQVSVLTTVLLIAVAIVGVLIVFNIVRPLVSEKSGGIGTGFKSYLQTLMNPNCGDEFCNTTIESCENCMADCGFCAELGAQIEEPIPDKPVDLTGKVKFKVPSDQLMSLSITTSEISQEDCNSDTFIKYSNCGPQPLYSDKIRADFHKPDSMSWFGVDGVCSINYANKNSIFTYADPAFYTDYICDYEIK